MVQKQLFGLLVLLSLVAAPAFAEEGMWPFHMVPKDEIHQSYGFEIDEVWLEKVRMSSLRFGSGGSASFISPAGLVMTNQHVGRGCIQELSHGKENLLRDGFYAKTPMEERQCPGLEVNQAVEITNVTKAVQEAASSTKDTAEKNKRRKEKMAALEKECLKDEQKDRCDVVTLYGGAEYHLYRYRKYTDVRLVWAPENDAKHFGGEKDNFEFPRMSLDVSFFRVYEEGKPVDSTAHYFSFAKQGAKDGDLVFVSGHPGRTGRFSAMGELKFLKNTSYPFLVSGFTKMRKRYEAYMERGERYRQTALADWLRASNAEKALTGYLRGLNDAELMALIQSRNEELVSVLKKKDSKAEKNVQNAWKKIDSSYAGFQKNYARYAVTEGYFAPRATGAQHARTLLRLSTEMKKESEKRLREYGDSNLPGVELKLFSEAPVDTELEVEKIALAIEGMVDVFGKKDPMIKKLLAGQTARARAEAVVKASKIYDVANRRALYEKNAQSAAKSKDAMIQFVKIYDKAARKYRRQYEDKVEAVTRSESGYIAEAFATAYGRDSYPDATFSLRLSYGTIGGYESNGAKIPWATRVGDVYRTNKRWKNQDPYVLPESYKTAIGRVDFSMPYNFVSTNDIIGGNSGSPVFNRDAEIVGLIFDGNIHQLSNRFGYRAQKERAVSVHAKGMLHVLKNVYGAHALVQEIQPPAKKKCGDGCACCN